MSKPVFTYTSKKSGKVYFLHRHTVSLRGQKARDSYFFSLSSTVKSPAHELLPTLPDGKEVGESERTGMPFLRNKR